MKSVPDHKTMPHYLSSYKENVYAKQNDRYSEIGLNARVFANVGGWTNGRTENRTPKSQSLAQVYATQVPSLP